MSTNDVLLIIFLSSLILGFIKYSSIADAYEHKPWQSKFIEIWNCTINFLIAGLVGYYFVLIRLQPLLRGGELKQSDLVLFVILALCLFGHLNVMSRNISEGIQAILSKLLKKD